ncbi:MAG: hypothetical protein AAGM38_18255 [Pseudomonadota bacterium]
MIVYRQGETAARSAVPRHYSNAFSGSAEFRMISQMGEHSLVDPLINETMCAQNSLKTLARFER